MRHLVGLIVGIVLSPVLFIAVAWSAWRQQVRVGTGRIFSTNLSVELLILVIALLIIAVIVAGRVSPLVGFLVGVPFLLDACLAIFSPRSLLNLTDHNNSIARGAFTIGIDDLALALGLVCVVPMLIRSRWPKWRPATNAMPAHSAPSAGYTAPTYDTSDYGTARDTSPGDAETRRIDVSEPDESAQRAAQPSYVPPTTGSTRYEPPPPPEAPRG
jgi:hypothetical protein